MSVPTTNPVVQNPNISLWRGIMSLNWDYKIPEGSWDGNWKWDGLPSGPSTIWDEVFTPLPNNFGFDFQYDFNNDGNWVTGTMVDGITGDNHDVDVAPAFNVFSTYWDLGLDVTEDSPNCKVRTRIKNRRTGLYSSWGYYGPVAIETIYTVIFMKKIGNQTYYWLPSVPPDYETPILDIRPGTSYSNTITGGRTSVKSRTNIQAFNLHWNVIPSADIDSLKEFLEVVDYRRLPFIYKVKEINHENPFGGTWKISNVKMDISKISKSQIRGDYYSLNIQMRQSVET